MGRRFLHPLFSNIISKTEKNATAGDVSNGRTLIWLNSLQLFSTRPLFGYGADTALSVYSLNAHNSVLQSLVELGLVGAIFYFFPFVYAYVSTIKLHLKRMSLNSDERAIMIFSLFWQSYIFIGAMFEGLFMSEIYVFMMFIAQMMVMRVCSNHIDLM